MKEHALTFFRSQLRSRILSAELLLILATFGCGVWLTAGNLNTVALILLPHKNVYGVRLFTMPDIHVLTTIASVTLLGLAGLYTFHIWLRNSHSPQAQLVSDLAATVRTLQRDHTNDVMRLETLEEQLQENRRITDQLKLEYERKIFEQAMKIRFLEAELTHYRNVLPAKLTYKPKKLGADELKTLRVALLDCYTTRNQWRTLLGDMDRNIDTISTADNLEDLAAMVLNAANDEGWLLNLMTEAAAGRMHVAALHELVAGLATHLGM